MLKIYLFLEFLNAKNGNNSILDVTLACAHEGYACELTELYCIQVDDEVAATNDDFPYNRWYVDANFIYSENCALGLPKMEKEDFILDQNPVGNILSLKCPMDSGPINIQIFNIVGKLLSTQNSNFQKQIAIDVSGLSAGLYFLSVVSKMGNYEVIKFIKE